jgi:hypothetical protein
MKTIVKLHIAAKGSYAYAAPYCTKYDHVKCGWKGVRI